MAVASCAVQWARLVPFGQQLDRQAWSSSLQCIQSSVRRHVHWPPSCSSIPVQTFEAGFCVTYTCLTAVCAIWLPQAAQWPIQLLAVTATGCTRALPTAT